jgi:Nif-specific regulatory protein
MSTELKSVIEVVAEMGSSLELDKALTAILNSLGRALQAEASSLLLLDDNGSTLHFKTCTGDKANEVKTMALSLGHGIVGWVAKSGRPLLVPDAQNDPRHAREIAQKLDFPCQSIVAAPVKEGGRIIGAVEVINRTDGKPFGESDLTYLVSLSNLISLALQNAKVHTRVKIENAELRQALEVQRPIIGNHTLMREAMDLVRKMAPYDITVLVTGESGTGKELIARAIHQLSPRAKGPFLPVNCSSVPDTLIESELFGHEKGAFTGAISERKGKFELAEGGTLFLDEIGDMSLAAQSKVLRAIEERTFDRVGGSKHITTNTRIVAATNKDLREQVEKNLFREDLFYRLNELCIPLPPLRNRAEDILPLAEHFVQHFSREFGKRIGGVANGARQLLQQYDWPGNVRELRNALKTAVILADGVAICPEHLPLQLRSAARVRHRPRSESNGSLASAERDHILAILTETEWNKTKAAGVLDISRPTLDAKIKAFDLKKE